MSQPPTAGATRADTPAPDPTNASTSQLVGDPDFETAGNGISR